MGIQYHISLYVMTKKQLIVQYEIRLAMTSICRRLLQDLNSIIEKAGA